jgi:TonB-linked SusC/RagA family outer membrane protein
MKLTIPTKRFSHSVCLICVLLIAAFHAQAQQTRVSGKVIDQSSQQPLPGVSIYQEGTAMGTVTDADGNYSLSVSDSSTLVFSSIGFVKELVKARGKTVINVSLRPDVIGLEEVVVVGYGEQKRSNLTGSLSSIKPDQMENKAVFRLDQALQGMAAGVMVTRNGGAPGAAPTIHIRGIGSINGTDPLWIVDGIMMSPDNHFDVDDVETMEVLKDASASAIYGARAAHGVILVTTKRGKGGMKVTLKSSVGKRSPVRLPQLLGTSDFAKFKNQARVNSGVAAVAAWDTLTTNTDWVHAFYNGSGTLCSNDLEVSNGNDKFNFYMSFGQDVENGILIDNTYKRSSIRINSDSKLAKWLKIGESALLSQVKENPVSNNNENYTGAVPYRSIPVMPIRDINNSRGGWGKAPDAFAGFFGGTNPVATQYQQHEKRTYNRLDGNVYAELTPLKGLMWRSTVGYNVLAYLGEKFNEAFDYGGFSNPLASLTYNSSSEETITANSVLTYTRTLGKHTVKGMVGYEGYQFSGKRFGVVGNGYPVDVAWSLNLTTGAIASPDRYTLYKSRLLSQFGRFNYDFDERYLFEFNIRRDGSSKFSPQNQWGIFRSYSVGWRISREAFFQNVPYITNLKLRASTGNLGSDNIDNFLYLKTYTSQFSTYSFDNTGKNKVPGYFISKYPNGEVGWEEINSHNIALDIGAFENKLTLSVDYYIKDTKRLLYPVPVTPSIGIAVHNFNPVSPAVNVGTLHNRGIDIELGYSTRIGKFGINGSMNTSFMKNTMGKLYGNDVIAGGYGGDLLNGMTRTENGHPISSFYGYVVQQMLNSPGDVYAVNTYAKDGIYQEAATGPGDFMYKDISGPDGVPDGEITAQYDRVYIGNPWPKMIYALNLNANYNQLIDIAIQFQGIQGVDVFNANKAYARNFFGDNNTTTDIYQAWTPENHTGNPRNIWNDPNGNFSKPSDYFIEDGSYLKLRNVQIGFNVPKRILDRVHVSKLRIYVNGNNLLTFTKYSGLDPEIAGSNTGRGVDYGVYPQVRTISGGLELQF